MQPPLYRQSKSYEARIAIGPGVLVLWTLVYLVDRPPEQSFLFDLSLFQLVPTLFGSLGQSLPTFTHVFAFSLLTVALLTSTKRVSVLDQPSWKNRPICLLKG